MSFTFKFKVNNGFNLFNKLFASALYIAYGFVSLVETTPNLGIGFIRFSFSLTNRASGGCNELYLLLVHVVL